MPARPPQLRRLKHSDAVTVLVGMSGGSSRTMVTLRGPRAIPDCPWPAREVS